MSIVSVKQSLMNGVAVVHRISCTAIEPRHGRGGTARQRLVRCHHSNHRLEFLAVNGGYSSMRRKSCCQVCSNFGSNYIE
jgi:hypothetical protein